MKSKKPKLMAAGHPDNFQTPASAVDILVHHLKKEWAIWEPAAGKGNLVLGLRDRGFLVRRSDILDGEDYDFLRMSPLQPPIDCIVTNPPFSIKEKFLARCYQLGKPFALLMPITSLGHGKMCSLFDEHGIQLLLPKGRINFETPNHEANLAAGKKTTSWFYAAWFCWKLNLPTQIVFPRKAQLSLIQEEAA